MRNLIIDEKLVVLFRSMPFERFVKCVDALKNAGVKVIEVCFNAKDPNEDQQTLDKIRYIAENEPQLCVGAGTVWHPSQVEAAYRAGADFIVSPGTVAGVIAKTKELGMISIPGACTPTECFAAHALGADIVKLFPLKQEDISYFTNIRTPLPDIRFMATGGINAENIQSFLKAGIDAVGTGASILKQDLLDNEDYTTIRKLAAEHVRAIRN